MWRVVFLMLAGCYGPSITTGAPCSTARDCPRDLVCAATGTCERVDVDAAIGDAPQPDGCWGAWLAGTQQLDTPTIVAELSLATAEANVSLADDDLTVFIARSAALVGSIDIYRATRTSVTAPFTEPIEVDELSSALSDGRVTLANGFGVLASERQGGAGGSDLWTTTRDLAGKLTVPTQKGVDTLATPANQFDPELSPDGLTLYYAQSSLGGQQLLVATRASPSEPFTAATVLPIAGAAAILADPTVSPDGRVIVFASGASSNDLDLYVAVRSSAQAAFGTATRLPINTAQVDGDPELAQDGCALLFSSNRPPSQSRDIWLAPVR